MRATRAALALAPVLWAGALAQTPASHGSGATLDYEFFKTRVEPILLFKRPGHARCYVCHSTGTTFRLERLSPGATMWNEEQSRRNFDSVKRLVVPGNVPASRFLTHPLAHEAGGDEFHSGGKHWDSQSNPEWQTMAAWVRGQKARP